MHIQDIGFSFLIAISEKCCHIHHKYQSLHYPYNHLAILTQPRKPNIFILPELYHTQAEKSISGGDSPSEKHLLVQVLCGYSIKCLRFFPDYYSFIQRNASIITGSLSSARIAPCIALNATLYTLLCISSAISV